MTGDEGHLVRVTRQFYKCPECARSVFERKAILVRTDPGNWERGLEKAWVCVGCQTASPESLLGVSSESVDDYAWEG